MKLPDLSNIQVMFDSEVTWHLTASPDRIAKLLVHYECMKRIQNIPGEIIECGVFKGESLVRFAHFRNLLGSNDSCKIIGFDNFDNVYPDTKYEEDQPQREHWMRTAGSESITTEQLSCVFDSKGFNNYEFIAGDIVKTVPEFVSNNKGLNVALLNINCTHLCPILRSYQAK